MNYSISEEKKDAREKTGVFLCICFPVFAGVESVCPAVPAEARCVDRDL